MHRVQKFLPLCTSPFEKNALKKATEQVAFLVILLRSCGGSNPHFAYSLRSYTSTHSFEDGIGGAVATTEASAKHQNLYEVAGALYFFLHQRNEWHNEATPLNVREPSVALPEGLCRMAEGGNT